MVALEQNKLFHIDLPNFKGSSIFKAVNIYITLLNKLNAMRKLYKYQFNHFDEFVIAYKIDNTDRINNLLDRLDDVSTEMNHLLEAKELQGWYMYPLYYLADRVEDWNMALQGLFSALEADIAFKELEANEDQ